MAEKNTVRGFAVYTIASSDGHTRASFVPEKGAVGSSIIMYFNGEERELLFLHNHFWEKDILSLPGGWPFLFPICGRLERMGREGDYLYDGHIYNLPIHGFAALMPWRVVASDAPDVLEFEITENKDTLAMYPFHFKVRLIYKIENGKLTCEQIYTNTGDKPMLYYAGFHPYFLTPDAEAEKEKVMLNYQPIRRFRYNDRLTDILGEKKLFELPVSAADHDINEQLTEVAKDNVVHLKFPDGFNLYMQARGGEDSYMFRYVHLYTMPGKPFICVEPLMGFPNALNTALGARLLLPGHSESGFLELFCGRD